MKEKDYAAVLQTSGSSMTFFNGIPPPLSSFFSMVRRALNAAAETERFGRRNFFDGQRKEA